MARSSSTRKQMYLTPAALIPEPLSEPGLPDAIAFTTSTASAGMTWTYDYDVVDARENKNQKKNYVEIRGEEEGEDDDSGDRLVKR